MDSLTRINKTLSLLGLSEIESLVYLDLLKLGSAPASLVARRLKLNRSTTRYTLENLCQKRLTFQENRNEGFYFSAEDPEKILLLLQDEQQKLEQKESSVSQIIGELKNLKNPHVNVPKVRFFEGVEGVIKMYEDVLEEGKKTKCTIYGYLHYDEEEFHPEFKKFVKERYIPEREKTQNKAFMIFNNKKSDINYTGKDSSMNRVTLFVPTEDFPFKTCFHIYGDKIAFYSHLNSQYPSGVIIQHQVIKDDHLNLFKMAWEFAKKLPMNKHYKDITL